MPTLDLTKLQSELVDRYLNFATELSRFALLGIAGIGFLITSATGETKGTDVRVVHLDDHVKLFVVIAAVSFVLSAAFALFYRYGASEQMRLRFQLAALEENPHADPQRTDIARKALFKQSDQAHRLLLFSSYGLVIGAAALVVAFGFAAYK
jgi:hypothetical protein